MKDTSKEDLKEFAEECNRIPLEIDDKYYLINTHWYQKWADYIGLNKIFDDKHGHNHPGVIENRSLVNTDGSLRSELVEDIDYKIIHENLWNRLKETYGIESDRDIIERRVINDSISGGMENLKVEVYLQNVKITNYETSPTEIRTVCLSRQAKLVDVIKRMKEEFSIAANRPARLYLKLSGMTYNLIEDYEQKTLADSGFAVVDTLCIMPQKEDGTWPELQEESIKAKIQQEGPIVLGQYPPPAPPQSSSFTTTTSPMTTRSSSSKNYHDSGYSNRYSESKAGLCGLNNLGNTCFMNSAIQCMSNVPLLSEYFVGNKYKSELNTINPLGQKGELAIAYAELVKEMWGGQNSYTSPRQLKLHISRFAPQFIGFQQQDSQELLSYLLDGLHEDLNRIIKKPYIEQVDDDTKTDDELSTETWNNYLKRNDSIITDLFHGLVKSTLNCLVCNKISIKFDPICYLSLPLPSKRERLIEITFVPLDLKQPLTKFKLTVLKNGSVSDLCTALEQFVGVPKQRMAVCDVYNSKIFHLFESSEGVSNIRERDEIYIYQLAANFNSPDHFKFNFYLKSKSTYTYNTSYFGLPIVFTIGKNELNSATVYDRGHHAIKRLIGESDDLNFNDTLNDEIDKKLIFNEEQQKKSESSADITDTDSSDRHQKQAKLAASSTKKYFFKLTLSKSDQYEPSDSPQIDDALLSQLNNVSHNYSIVAECPTKLKDHLQDNKFLRNVVEHESCNAKLINKRDVLTLDDCFNLFTKKEELSDSDLWYCPKCKQHQHATKQMDLWTLPPVLIIHLKRFSYSRTYRDKIDTLVEFPIRNLDFSKYIKGTKKPDVCNKYNLIAVSNHYGGLGGGHYTAYGQNRYDGRWYNFDDSSVSSSDETSVITPAAYLLVYLREDLHAKHIPAANVPSSSSSTANATNDNLMDTN